jgi:hypothetical protein
VWTSRKGFEPVARRCAAAAMCDPDQPERQIEEMAVEGALTGNRG